MSGERELSREIREAALWLEEMAERYRYCDVGFSAKFHAGAVSRIDFNLTTKQKQFGGQHERERNV